MGPGIENGKGGLPNRPRFSWDVRSVPWTDGKGKQDDYADAVELWSAFHDALPGKNSNKIPAELRGIMLQANLFGRAKDLAKKIPDTTIRSNNGASAIVRGIHKRDTLSTVSAVYSDFISLLCTKRGEKESFKNFESRFEANVSKFNSHSEICELPESLTAFLLLANANVDNSQKIAVLAAASPKEAQCEQDATTTAMLSAVTYTSVASVLCQCENKTHNGKNTDLSSLVANSAQTHGIRRKQRLTPEQLADLKSKSVCHLCNQKGHWKSDHNADGSLKPGVKSVPIAPTNDTNGKRKQ